MSELIQQPRVKLDALVRVGVCSPMPRVYVDVDIQDTVVLFP